MYVSMVDQRWRLKIAKAELIAEGLWYELGLAALYDYEPATDPRCLTEGGPGKQVTTTGVGPGNICKWKLNFFQKFEFKERGYFGTIKKNDSKIKPQVTPR